jgi:hypothetical protein
MFDMSCVIIFEVLKVGVALLIIMVIFLDIPKIICFLNYNFANLSH